MPKGLVIQNVGSHPSVLLAVLSLGTEPSMGQGIVIYESLQENVADVG